MKASFGSIVRRLLVVEKRGQLRDVARTLGMEYATLHSRLNGRTAFRVEEAIRLLAAVPDFRLADALLENTPFIAVERPQEVGWEGPREAKSAAIKSAQESLAALEQIQSIGVKGRITPADRNEIAVHVQEAERALARLKLAVPHLTSPVPKAENHPSPPAQNHAHRDFPSAWSAFPKNGEGSSKQRPRTTPAATLAAGSAWRELALVREERDRLLIEVQESIDELKLANEAIGSSNEALMQGAQAASRLQLRLEEANHRVRNSLQFVASLLSFEGARADDPGLRATLEEAARRVRTIAVVDAMLNSANDRDQIDVRKHLQELALRFLELAADATGSLAITVEGTGPKLSGEEARSLGLIANELMINGAKHGRRRDGSCRIDLRISTLKNDGMRLEVEDSGPGFPVGFDPASGPTLGMKIVSGLIRQHGGRLAIEHGLQGARVVIEWPRASIRSALSKSGP